MNITIKTYSHWNNFLYGYELTEKERADFDYIDDIDSHDFMRYRGIIYDPCEFMRVPDNATMALDKDYAPMMAWQGYQSDSYFSGVLIRYSDDCEQYQIGRYSS